MPCQLAAARYVAAHLELYGQAMAVPAGHVDRTLASHELELDDDVLQHLHKTATGVRFALSVTSCRGLCGLSLCCSMTGSPGLPLLCLLAHCCVGCCCAQISLSLVACFGASLLCKSKSAAAFSRERLSCHYVALLSALLITAHYRCSQARALTLFRAWRQ